MFDYKELETIVGCFCTLLYPFKGQTEGTIVEDMDIEVVVQLINGKEATAYRDAIIAYD